MSRVTSPLPLLCYYFFYFLSFSFFSSASSSHAQVRENKGAVGTFFGAICNLAIYACVLECSGRHDAAHFFIYLALRCAVFAGSIGTEWIPRVEWEMCKNLELCKEFIGSSGVVDAVCAGFISGLIRFLGVWVDPQRIVYDTMCCHYTWRLLVTYELMELSYLFSQNSIFIAYTYLHM